MSALTDIYSFVQGNSTITNQVPLASWFFGLVPPSKTYPYVAITIISGVSNLTTGKPYFEDTHFQLSIYSQDLHGLETIADTIDGQFNKATISAGGMACQRVNRLVFAEAAVALTTYHVMLEYVYLSNATLP